MMELKTISNPENRYVLLACEALGFLHNIGKLDNRFHSGENFDFQKIVEPSTDLTWDSDKLKELKSIYDSCSKSTQTNNEKEKNCALSLAKFLLNEKHSNDIDKAFNTHWKNYKSIPDIYQALKPVGLGREFPSGFHLLRLWLKDGFGLEGHDVTSFVQRYVALLLRPCLHPDLQGLKVLDNTFSFSLLLNLFWDKFHWVRRDTSPPVRDDNLTFWLGKEHENLSRFARIMAVCHEAISRGDKGEGLNSFQAARGKTGNWTNVFGSGISPIETIPNLSNLIKKGTALQLIESYHKTASDGKLPINDVALYDYCENFGAFLKTALAKILLEGKYPKPNELKWQILSVRADGLDWISRGGRLADAVARRRTWDDVFEAITRYLELELPLAKRIYQDSNGAFFLWPDVDGLLEMKISGTNTDSLSLAEKIQQISTGISNGEIELRPQVSEEPMYGYDIRLAGLIHDKDPVSVDPTMIDNCWRYENGSSIHAEVCTVCGLRPIAVKKVAKKQRVCGVCHGRRTGRAAKWLARDITSTIWISELADKNDRCALLAAGLGLENTYDLETGRILGGWLDGRLFQSLAGKWTNGDGDLSFGPSFTRMRDAWQCTEKFFTKMDELLASGESSIPPKNGRWLLRVQDSGNSLFVNHAYELETRDGRLQVVCIGSEENNHKKYKKLLIIDSRAPEEQDKLLALLPVKNGDKREIKFFMRGGYGAADIPLNGDFSMDGEPGETEPYTPYINIITDPLRFLVVVPADAAMEVAKKLHDANKKQFLRVQDRLPLNLGIVYFPARTPMFTVLDAGIRLLNAERPALWSPISACTLEDHGKIMSVTLEDGKVFQYGLDKDNHALLGGHPDIWYIRPWINNGWRPLVDLACDGNLEGRGFNMRYHPSTLDIVFLAESVRRRQIYYQEGKRDDPDFGAMPLRPEDMSRLKQIWETLKRLSRSQLGQLEEARNYVDTELDGAPEEAKHHFLGNALRTAGDGWWRHLPENAQKLIKESVADSLLWTVLTLHLHLLKDKPADEKKLDYEENEI
jgi:hypothetical protein